MAMGIVSNDAFEKEVVNVVIEHVVIKDKGRGIGNNEVPMELKKLIAEEAINGTSAKVLSGAFGISESSVNAYKHNATSTASYHKPNEELVKSNNSVRDTISNKAQSKLLEAIESITKDDLQRTKVKDRASIASAMSNVVKNMREETNPDAGVKVMIYSPRVKMEDDYNVIEVNE